jgi:hypothetical protein
MRKFALAAPLALFVLLAAPLGAQEPSSSEAPLFSAYPSYDAKFDITGEKFTLVTNMLVYNISGKTFTDVSFKQVYPEGVSVKETFQRDVGADANAEQKSARKVEGNAFYASIQTFKHRQYVVIFNELQLARRLNAITFPGLEISYTDSDGKRQTAKMHDDPQDLFVYSNVVGGLDRFIKKYNNIELDFEKATPSRKEWEFAPVAASSKGRFPTGVIGTNPGADQYSGWFRLRTGPPGDMLQLVTIYKKTSKSDAVATKDAAMSDLRDYLRWCGEFEYVPEGLQVTQEKWKKYNDSWKLSGQWRDTVKNRLGGGPVLARVFYGAHEDVQYYVLALGQGRPLGEASAQPNPDKEQALLAEMNTLVESFRSDIVPLSINHR